MTPITADSATPIVLGVLALGTALLFHDVISWAIGVAVLLLAFGIGWLISRATCRGTRTVKDGP